MSPGIGLFFAAGGGAAVGMLPQLAPSAALSFGVLGAGWRAALRIGYAPAQHATLEDPPGVGGRVSLANIAAEGGFRWQWGRLEVPLVAGLESGFFVAEGEGVETHAPELAAWLASYLSSGASYALTRVFCLGFRVEALVALRRPQFAVESSAGQQYPFYRPAPLGGRLFVELEVRLP
jgi:CubicO group peptidase (beta-lactamase class C family)